MTRINNLFFRQLLFLILILFFGGILTNFGVYFLNLNFDLKTLFIDINLILLLFIFIYLFIFKKLVFPNRNFVKYFLFVNFSLIAISFTADNYLLQIKEIRNLILYAYFYLGIVCFLTYEQSIKIQRLFIFLFGYISIFAILQSYKILPNFLLYNVFDGIFGFGGTEIIRPDGLVGNTIIFNYLLLLGGAFFLAYYLATKKILFLFLFFTVFFANYLTYSRFALVAYFLISFFVLQFFYFRLSFLFKNILLFLFLSLIFIVYVIYSDSFYIEKFFGNVSAGATERHIQMKVDSIDQIKDNFFIGAGFGTQSKSTVDSYKKAMKGQGLITDGLYFAQLVQLGVPIGIVYILLPFYALFLIYRKFRINQNLLNYKNKIIPITFISTNIVYLFLGNFINSAFIGPVPFIFFWIFFGISLIQLKKI